MLFKYKPVGGKDDFNVPECVTGGKCWSHVSYSDVLCRESHIGVKYLIIAYLIDSFPDVRRCEFTVGIQRPHNIYSLYNRVDASTDFVST